VEQTFEATWRREALTNIVGFMGVGFPASALVFAAFTGMWRLALICAVVLAVGTYLVYRALRNVAENRLEIVEAAWETVNAVAGIERLRLRVIIHTALRGALELTGDPHAPDLVDPEQMDYLVEHTVDAIIATSPGYERRER
jgi:hypothetical protein